ncbi:holin family protein [bacterium]|nr:holin family protein [bacterium]
MLKLLLGLLKGGNGEKSPAGNLAWEIREAIKGKELDPNELIALQTKINEIEAQHRSVFVAGWRPAVGWTSAIALMYNFVVRDLFIWMFQPEIIPPALQMEHLMTVLMGMLGLGGLRTYEKINNKTR